MHRIDRSSDQEIQFDDGQTDICLFYHEAKVCKSLEKQLLVIFVLCLRRTGNKSVV